MGVHDQRRRAGDDHRPTTGTCTSMTCRQAISGSSHRTAAFDPGARRRLRVPACVRRRHIFRGRHAASCGFPRPYSAGGHRQELRLDCGDRRSFAEIGAVHLPRANAQAHLATISRRSRNPIGHAVHLSHEPGEPVECPGGRGDHRRLDATFPVTTISCALSRSTRRNARAALASEQRRVAVLSRRTMPA